MSTYRVIRCPGCYQFTYTDQYGKWKLCPVCGEVITVDKVPVYLEVDDFSQAEILIKEVERYLYRSGRLDLTPTEVNLIREKYLAWLMSAA
ncbi:DUF1922 domain-containing protein [Methanorbis rubei]|uniref:DUF1922 domain-containing protein n=1 Tax=Methanorbis rubei TaxID=3028300 RepID=A0AAE4SCX2_9EURY|nr:hypothetical protein [Methanocorpusculaceae archaeon Cs1]